jgi:hypothetical protein
MSLTHGTFDGYNNHGCRCEECKKAASDYHRSRRVPCPGGCGTLIYGRYKPGRMCNTCTRKRMRKKLVHGTEPGYAKGCRCKRCTAAANQARRERRQRSKA